jgi:hypothetical protein
LTADRSRGAFETARHNECPDALLFDPYTDKFPRIRLLERVRAFEAFATTRVMWNLRMLPKMIQRVARRNALAMERADSFDLAQVKRLVGTFSYLRPYMYSRIDRCLFDSLVLLEYLARYRVPASLVIGVRTRSFQAHSWVQLGRYVLNDAPEHVSGFTPILTV